MAVTAPIPLPQTGMDALMGSAAGTQSMINSIMQNRLVPYQAAELQGKAAESQMMANLINQVLGGTGTASAPGLAGGATDTSTASGTGGSAGAPNKAAILAGLLHIPIDTKVIDGKVVQNNPFSGTTVQQVGTTPEQQEQSKTDIGAASKIEEAARAARDKYSLYSRMNESLKNDPSLTGWTPAGQFFFGQAPASVSNFVQLTKDAQIAGDRSASSRGGAYALKWAASAKPNVRYAGDQNQGMINAEMGSTTDEYNNMDREYFEKTGKHLPPLIDESAGQNAPANTTMMQPPATNATPTPVNSAVANQGVSDLARGLKLPNFKNANEFRAWFDKQPKMVQDAVRAHLKGKK